MKTLRAVSEAEHARGRQIEDGLLRYLTDLRDNDEINTFGQADAFYLRHGKLCLVEVKSQSMYTAGFVAGQAPFDGHGLPVAQAHRYRLIYETTGVRTILIVWDDTTCWMQWIDKLEEGPSFDTNGSKTGQRRIYPLDSFDQYHELFRYGRRNA